MALKYLIGFGCQNQRLTVYTVSAITSICLLHWTINLQTSVLSSPVTTVTEGKLYSSVLINTYSPPNQHIRAVSTLFM